MIVEYQIRKQIPERVDREINLKSTQIAEKYY